MAPIALYPDPLLAQTLVASTYPLEIIQLQQWMAKHPGLKDKALADSVAKQPWDPSIQSMAVVPDVVKRLADDIQWTTELGNAFLAQQDDVMDAVQAMRKKAMDKGALTSNEQQKVDTQVVEKQTVIVVQPTNPEVIYVPVYTPTVVYGPPAYYPYPPIYYPPPPPPGAYLVAFTVGVVWRSAVWGGSCCYAGWGHGGGNTVIINNNNNFNQINHQRWRRQQQLAAQPVASRRGALPEPERLQQVRRPGRAAARRRRQRQHAAGRWRGQRAARAGGPRAPVPSRLVARADGLRARRAPQPAGGAGQRGRRGAGPERQHPAVDAARRGNQVGGRDVPSSTRRPERLQRRPGRVQRLECPGEQFPRRVEHGLEQMAAHGVGGGGSRGGGGRR